MYKLKLNVLSCLALALLIAPACKRSKSSKAAYSTASPSQSSNKTVSIFDGDLEAFVIDEVDSAFGPQSDSFEFIDESEGDFVIDQSRQGFMPIYFEFDANSMKPAQAGALENNLARAKKLISQGKQIVIEGHACKFAGSSEYNMHLSERRAKHIYDYFVKNGIPAEKVSIVGRGNELCVVQNGNKEQQSPNRRVEFIAIEK